MKRALVVDDDSAIRKILGFALEKMGFVVDFAENGYDGATKTITETFDLIVIDMAMPVMDGCESITLIRNNELASSKFSTSIIAMSSDEQVGPQMIKVGANVFIAKPFQISDFIKLVSSATPEKT